MCGTPLVVRRIVALGPVEGALMKSVDEPDESFFLSSLSEQPANASSPNSGSAATARQSPLRGDANRPLMMETPQATSIVDVIDAIVDRETL